MPVITIRGSLGSGAPEIGRQVAERLHLDYVDREIIAEVAAQLSRQEQDVVQKEMPRVGLLARIAEALEHTYGFEGIGLPPWEMPLDDTRYLESLQSVIRKLAANRSIVIYGRGSQFILRDFPGAFHVMMVAPLKVRVKRVMQDLKSDEGTARREIARFDDSGREFIKRYFRAELGDPEYYDLVINTNNLSFDVSASIIIDALSEGQNLERTGKNQLG